MRPDNEHYLDKYPLNDTKRFAVSTSEDKRCSNSIAFAKALRSSSGVAITWNLKFSLASVLPQCVFMCFAALSDDSLSSVILIAFYLH